MSEKISDSHKATIKRHIEESPDLSLDQVHSELLEIFRHKGRYSLPQITAVSSWLLSEKLQQRRANPPDWKEDFGDTSEDIDYNTPAKITSREWHFNNIAKHTTGEQRDKMKLLLMPGRNTFDYQEAEKIGLNTSNLITYMRGDVPAANAEYIRNSRKFGIQHRRIGDLESGLVTEDQNLHGAYLDFFGQYCPSYLRILNQLPLDPNCEAIPIGINLMAGREHAKTGQEFQQLYGIASRYRETATVADDTIVRERIEKIAEESLENPVQANIARERVLMMRLFGGVGVANTKNWLLTDEVKNFVTSYNKYENYDDLSSHEKFEAFAFMMTAATRLFENTGREFSKYGVPVDLAHLALGTRMAIVNSAPITHIEEPTRYISPNGNRPFLSYFALLKTHRNHYEKYTKAMSYFLKIAGDSLRSVLKGGGPGYFDSTGPSKNRMLRYFSPITKNPLASINIDLALESSFGLTEHSCTPKMMGHTDEEWQSLMRQKMIASLMASEMNEQPKDPYSISPEMQKKLYYSLCPCGSGKQYGNCCKLRK